LGALLYVALPLLAAYGVIRSERQARAAAAPSFVGDK
jgi:hypothetical protein